MGELWFNLLKKASNVDDDAIYKMGSVELIFLSLHWSSFTVAIGIALSGLLLIAAFYL